MCCAPEYINDFPVKQLSDSQPFASVRMSSVC